jgi:hypothetical protein
VNGYTKAKTVLDWETHAKSQIVTVYQDKADSLDETARTDVIIIYFFESF